MHIGGKMANTLLAVTYNLCHLPYNMHIGGKIANTLLAVMHSLYHLPDMMS